jgi:catechol 2,3-dioxygenase-like lactoylglutathione lyase family enzyme
MSRCLDHVVLWVENPVESVAFYERIVGLEGVRVAEFREGKVPFPSVRVSEHTILDLMAKPFAAAVDGLVGRPGSGGHPVNHVCLSMDEAEFDALRERLAETGAYTSPITEGSFGAQGNAPRAFYFHDPDGNVLEARYYAA